MSLTIREPVQPVLIQQELINVNDKPYYGVLDGGSRCTWITEVTDSFSNNGFNLNAPPPNLNTYIDRHVRLRVPIRIEFSGTCPVGQKLLQSGFDALRAFPISSNIETLTLTLNNQKDSIDLGDMNLALLRYNTDEKLRNGMNTTSPSMLDQAQQYSMLTSSVANPLSSYIDATYGSSVPRGAFPYSDFSNNTSTDETAQTTGFIETTLVEDIYLSPLIFGTNYSQKGFIGVQTFQLNVTWKNNLARMWSHSNDSGVIFSSVNVIFTDRPGGLFKYVTPPLYQSVPDYVNYSYTQIQKYVTTLGNYSIDQQRREPSRSIRLNSIPQKMYIFARKRNADLTFTDSDAFFSIENISIQWANYSGLMSNATKQDLYKMCVENGLNDSWASWCGENMYNFSGSDEEQINGIGSVMCIKFGKDICLQDDEAPGLLGVYDLRYDVDLHNRSGEELTFPELYTIIVSEGVYTIYNNSSYAQIGVLSRDDILDVKQKRDKNDLISTYQIQQLAGTGNIFSDIGSKLKKLVTKKNIRKVANTIRKGLPVAKKIAEMGATALYPEALPAVEKTFQTAQKVLDVGKKFGVGSLVHKNSRQGCAKRKPGRPRKVGRPKKGSSVVGGRKKKGKARIGGKMISRKDLEKMLKSY